MKRSGKTFIGAGAIAIILIVCGIIWKSQEYTFILSNSVLYSNLVLIICCLLVFPAVYLSDRLGFPGIWSREISIKGKLFYPLLLGLALGLSQIAASRIQQTSIVSIEFPVSLPAYLHISILHELALNFIPLIILLSLVNIVMPKRNNSETFFWILASLISLYEPAMQSLSYIQMGMADNIASLLVIIEIVYISNLLAFGLLRKYGLSSAIIFRFAIYVTVNIIWYNIL